MLFQVNFRVASKQINLEDKTCKLSDGTRVPCVDVDVSLKYDGVGVPDTIGKYKLFWSIYKTSQANTARPKNNDARRNLNKSFEQLVFLPYKNNYNCLTYFLHILS